MEENVNDTQKVQQPTSTPVEENMMKVLKDNSAEDALNGAAKLVLIIGLVATIICFFTLCFTTKERGYHSETEFNLAGLTTTFMILLSTLISWSVMRVLANISLTLKDIDKKIK